jgi:kynurenine formamidase
MSEFVQLLKNSKVISLGVKVHPNVPLGDGHPKPIISPLLRHGDSLENFLPTTVANELMICTQHTGTHIDALNHIGCQIGDDIFIHGHHRTKDIESHQGFCVHDASSLKPIVGRAVLLDIAWAKDMDVLPDSYSITVNDIESAILKGDIVITNGDTVILRTGFMHYWEKDPKRFTDRSAGLSLEGAKFLVEQFEVQAIGTDTVAIEVIPSECLEVHQYCLFEKGIPLIENMYLEELHKERIWEFGIIVAPNLLQGATASMINPIALVPNDQ